MHALRARKRRKLRWKCVGRRFSWDDFLIHLLPAAVFWSSLSSVSHCLLTHAGTHARTHGSTIEFDEHYFFLSQSLSLFWLLIIFNSGWLFHHILFVGKISNNKNITSITHSSFYAAYAVAVRLLHSNYAENFNRISCMKLKHWWRFRR